ncbi:TraX family protein [Paenibacillus sp. UMB4589-SE434]|uniref:TraX family protein n=1 Tax=Paenibacillus sp. UMB4589-SE434 TaxID=3046314 RepID=UPI00254D85D7|nr:TraX family protein [Paenibacillus sp. UMB4589-SE434]MDK8181214.1 TraX family protein [Paenibacillus sp. UMB4589-SE434]
MNHTYQRFGMDAFWLKIVAMLLMVVDHVTSLLPLDYGEMGIYLHYPGRIVAPIFFFFLVEGFFFTRSRVKYLSRIMMWAAIMAAGSYLLSLIYPELRMLSNNIFLSLGLGVVLLIGLDWMKQGSMHRVIIGLLLAIAASAVSVMYTEASIYGVICTLVFYFCRERKWLLSVVYIATVLLLTIGVGGDADLFNYEQLMINDPQWMMVFALPFLLLYNGNRGNNSTAAKYMFYVFYPLHLWLLYIISYYLI